MGAGGRSQRTAAQQDSRTRTEPQAGLCPQVTHAVPLGSPRDTPVSPQAGHSSAFLPILLQTSQHPRLLQKITSAAPSSQVTPKAESRLPLPFPFKTRFFPFSARVNVLRLLYPNHTVSPCAGADALSPRRAVSPAAPPAAPSPGAGATRDEPRNHRAAAQDPFPILPQTQGWVISSPPIPAGR